MNTYIFYDSYNKKGSASPGAVIVKADSEDEAWEVFARKYAVSNFGLKKGSTGRDVLEHFGDSIEVIGPSQILDLGRGEH